MKRSLNADAPFRRTWKPGGEWKEIILRHEYNDAFFIMGASALSAVRWRNWKMYLNPSLELYDLSTDPGGRNLFVTGISFVSCGACRVCFKRKC